jgi:hypothetical protein
VAIEEVVAGQVFKCLSGSKILIRVMPHCACTHE